MREPLAPACSISSPTSKTEVAVVSCAGYVCYGTMLSLTKDPVDTTKVITIIQAAWRCNLSISVYLGNYRKFGNFRCQNIFVVAQDYENKFSENFYTTNN